MVFHKPIWKSWEKGGKFYELYQSALTKHK